MKKSLKYKFAAKMRRNKTWPEKMLWSRLRDKKLGVPFRSQVVTKGYIADFYAASVKLVVETDGSYHLKKAQQVYDKHRDAVMAKAGILTMRFTAKEIAANLPACVALIRAEVERRKA